MTISKELYLAILSMDAYNRGYGAGIELQGSQIGVAKIDKDSEEIFRLPGQDPNSLSPAATAGFYAVAYIMGDDAPEGLAGKTVISYRGTDNTSLFSDPIAADPATTPPSRVVTDAIRIEYARHTPKSPKIRQSAPPSRQTSQSAQIRRIAA